MKPRRRKAKKPPTAAPEAAPSGPGPAERLRLFADSSQGRYGIPLFLFVAALLLAGWTFDPKLSLSGDNTEFITLARSLAQGEGLTHINSPHPEPATKYPFGFPLLLLPLEGLFPGAWVPMKWLVAFLFALSVPVFYGLVREKLGLLPALAAAALCLLTGNSSHSGGPLLLDYAHQVMSEVPYLAFSLLALLLLERGVRRPGIAGNYWLIGGFLCAMWAYYVRTVGLMLIAAVVAYLLVQRDWRRALSFAGAAFLFWLPWTLRNRAVGGGGVYVKQLLMVNPYYPDQGLLDIGGLFGRLGYNADIYLTRIFPDVLWPWSSPPYPFLSPLPICLIALAAYVTVVSLKRRRDLLLFFYTAFFLGTVLLWFWQGDRFLVPIVPLLLFFVVRVALDALSGATRYGYRPVATWVLWALWAALLFGNLGGLDRLSTFARSDYPRHLQAWTNYHRAGEWLRENAPPESVVLCRKGYWLYIVSGHPCVGFPFAEPDSVIAHMEREKVDYVVVESLGFSQTPRFLVPAITQNQDRFPLLWQRDDPPTYVLGFHRQK